MYLSKILSSCGDFRSLFEILIFCLILKSWRNQKLFKMVFYSVSKSLISYSKLVKVYLSSCPAVFRMCALQVVFRFQIWFNNSFISQKYKRAHGPWVTASPPAEGARDIKTQHNKNWDPKAYSSLSLAALWNYYHAGFPNLRYSQGCY